ncbi:DUF3152 domain-containing protein [Streptomyces justiciae]|uniref:DUF3152 domain-containing protein n=1 Tax=Streptomyces justiciae TaxID=2780140 RepID=A0ABU3M1P8_9ACTN|nr:DUF3152 domain-containing protein [Streptomyces justiciae]MDT7844946.1 DUF3152 domain-containing protein [Streptomyces justiciae]
MRVGLAALTVLGAVGCTVVAWPRSGPPPRSSDNSLSEPTRRPSPNPTPSSTPRPETSPSASKSPALPRQGPGTYVTAPGGSARVGKGTPFRYRVEVEKNIDLSATETAEAVDRILGDPRGWTADGHSAFQRVADGPTDFVVRLATPATVDAVCGQSGLDTGGKYNCSANDQVMVNLDRWVLATPVYAKDVTAYRALIINHEVGHFLHHGHVTCPGKGKPAPAMMQQIKGMHGCVPNVWPYDAEGRLITGPAAP